MSNILKEKIRIKLGESLFRSLLIYICLSFFVSIACAGQKMNFDTFILQMNKYVETYFTSEIDEADSAMKDLEKLIISYKENNVEGILYDQVLWRTYGRLYLISNKKGKKDESVKYLELALRHLKEASKRFNLKDKKMIIDQKYTINMINKWDKRFGTPVWKSE